MIKGIGFERTQYRKRNKIPQKQTVKAYSGNLSGTLFANTDTYRFSNPISFGYNLKDTKNAHLNYYGANLLPNGKVCFRVYSDKEKIDLQIANNDRHDEYWQDVSSGIKNYPMKKDGRIFEITPDEKISQGALYRFRVVDKDKRVHFLKDPRSAYQPNGAMGWSCVYNHDTYKWNDAKWQQGLDNRKIKHNNDENNWGIPSGLVISEKHIGLLGGFEAAKAEIDKIAQEGICNTIHILPIGQTYGDFNQGYEDVDKFAPNNNFGTPDDLKSFVDYAHQKGINLILDVVPNHFGFIGNSATQFANASNPKINTGWGPALKFDGEDGEYMRKYMSDMMINWLVNYHFDGLRIDATEQLFCDSFLKYFASEIRNHPETKDAILLPEHIEKTRKLAQPLNKTEISDPLKTLEIARKKNLKADSLGYDIQYIYDFKNTLTALLLGIDVYDCPPSIEDLAVEYTSGNRFYDETSARLPDLKANNSYVYPNMHDEFIVFGGVRPVVRNLAKLLGLFTQDAVKNPDGLDKKPFHKAEEMLENYLNCNYDAVPMDKSEFQKVYKKAQAMNRLMLSSVFMHPAQKGFSVGDEVGELTPWRFFADYDNEEIKKQINTEKGYDVGISAFRKSSKIFNPIEDKEFKKNTTKLSRDFSKLIKENPALKYGDYEKILTEVISPNSLFIHRWDGDRNDIFAIANFSDEYKTYDNIELFPDGKWSEVLNTDNIEYGGSGFNNDSKSIERKDYEICLAPYSLAVFKRDYTTL